MSETSLIHKFNELYANDPKDPWVNWSIGTSYYEMEQYASAVSFFLRAAEAAIQTDPDLSYECLIYTAMCHEALGNRSTSVKGLYEHAIALCPQRQEAYWKLSVFLENAHHWDGHWIEAYRNAMQGLNTSDVDTKKFGKPIGYKGKWMLEFQAAHTAWHAGKFDESRIRMAKLMYRKDIDDKYADLIHQNAIRLNLTRPDEHYMTQTGIDRNYSEAKQDLEAFKLAKFEEPFYLEIGAGQPFHGSNTFYLEKNGWQGIGIEIDPTLTAKHAKFRNNPIVEHDATTLNYAEILGNRKFVDYLQVDCDPSDITYKALRQLFNCCPDVTFGFITYEHDKYLHGQEWQDKAYEFLTNRGYTRYKKDVTTMDGRPFEDWYVYDENASKKTGVNMFKISKDIQANKRAFVVDGFYEDPMAVREFALQQEYIQGGIGRGFIGARSEQQFLFDGLKETFESVIGIPITKWEDYGMNGRFQKNIAGEPIVYHADSQRWAAMVYLTPDAPVDTGTSSYRHKESQVYHAYDINARAAFAHDTRLDATPYEELDKFGNVFNRLVIFDGHMIHAARGYFGSKDEDCRLWHMFFFDTGV